MRTSLLLAAAVVILVALGAGAAGQVSTVPRLGTGTVSVEGDVSVKGDVRVTNEIPARQSGPWRVAVEGEIPLAPRVLPFVRAGRSYEIRWGGQASEVVVADAVYDTWLRVVDSSGGRSRGRWINLLTVQSIAERAE